MVRKMSKTISEEIMEKIIFRLIRNADEAYAEHIKDRSDEFEDGRSLAYYEMLDTIQNELEANGVDLKKYNLDVNLEEKYI